MTNLATPLPETQVRDIPLKHIQADPIQIRRQFTQEELEMLAASIRECGVIQPIVVQPTPPDADGQMAIIPFQIIAGERRWRASIMAGLESIPAVVREGLTPERAQVLQVIENLQRQDLTLQELCAGVSILVDKMGLGEAAKQLGQSKAWVSRHATLRELPEQVRTIVEGGKLQSAEMAADLGKIIELAPDHWRTKQVLMEVNQGKLTRVGLRDAHQFLKAEQEREEKWRKQREEDQKHLDSLGGEDDDDLTPAESAGASATKLEGDQRARERAEEERLDEEFERRSDALTEVIKPALLDYYTRICTSYGLTPARDEDTNEVVLPEWLDSSEDGVGCATFSIDLPYNRRNHGADEDNQLPAHADDVPVLLETLLPFSKIALVVDAITGDQPQAVAAGSAMPPRFESIRTFLAKATKEEAGASAEAGALFEAYGKFCKKAKLEATDNANEFSTTLEILGKEKKRLNSGRVWMNLKLQKA